MKRVKKFADSSCPAQPPALLQPTAVYTRLQATALLGLAPSTLATEIRKGRLRVSRRAGRYFILGRWLLEWIERGELSSRRRHKEVSRSISPRGEMDQPGRAEG